MALRRARRRAPDGCGMATTKARTSGPRHPSRRPAPAHRAEDVAAKTPRGKRWQQKKIRLPRICSESAMKRSSRRRSAATPHDEARPRTRVRTRPSNTAMCSATVRENQEVEPTPEPGRDRLEADLPEAQDPCEKEGASRCPSRTSTATQYRARRRRKISAETLLEIGLAGPGPEAIRRCEIPAGDQLGVVRQPSTNSPPPASGLLRTSAAKPLRRKPDSDPRNFDSRYAWCRARRAAAFIIAIRPHAHQIPRDRGVRIPCDLPDQRRMNAHKAC